MTTEIKIYVKNFSDDPFGRDDQDGPFIGSAFVGLMTIDKVPYQTILSKLEVLPKDSVYPETVKMILDTKKHIMIGRA